MADKKQAKADKGKGAAAAGSVLRVAGHPRAAQSIRTIKGWAGLAGFVVTFWLSWRSGVPFYWSALRAVLGGAVVYVVAWACAVTFWRNLLVAEVEAARAKAMAEIEHAPAASDGALT